MSGIYLHIPFCERKCIYCDFYSVPFAHGFARDYITAICKEMSLKKPDAEIRSIYIGGGTPSALSVKNIERLLHAIKLHLPLANDYELTFEARFYEFDDDKIDACLKGGVNRFSLGVQSFDTKVRR